MRIIKATLEHLDLLTPLFVRYREFYGELPYPDSSRKFLQKRLMRSESVIYLALPVDDDSKLLGFCQLYPSYSSLSLKRVWILNDIFVAEDSRRMLVADHLMREAKKMAKETNAVRMRVSTSANNEVARKTYESIGFRKDTEFENYILPISQD
ncbi:GNAT family N-acetyltransferase [Pseudomonas sp. NPDC089401]|uniref:GNAT family N-acetyltransferase n=1 Tax=Pseudomonas sp. NPDC089401 TaxID=3364462 RepID=UPI003818E094